MNTALLLSSLFLLAPIQGRRDAPKAYKEKVSLLAVMPSDLGDDWKQTHGLVVDDMEDLSGLTIAEKRTLRPAIAQFRRMGVVGMADFSYDQKADINMVSLQVLQFQSVETARRYWSLNYQSPGWQRFYVPVDGLGDRAFHSTRSDERVVLVGNCVLTATQFPKGTHNERLMQLCLKKLTNPPSTSSP
ncbi:hypothetical protein [Planctomycetes bacterium Pan216]